MSTAMQTTEPKEQALREWVQTDEARREIGAAIGDIMPPEQFIAHMLVSFQDEKIRACTAKSKFRAMMECAAMGLLETAGQVVLIPYQIGDSGTYEVKAMPQWQGFKALMERHPDILEVIGVLVHLNDDLSTKEGELHHSYDPFDENREIQSSKDLRGGYLKIIYRDGRPPKYHMVRRKTIEQAQGCAKTQKMWNKWYYEMALKTVYRNAYARRAVPIDPLVGARLERVLKIEDVNLGNDPMRIRSEASTEHIDEARRLREAADTPERAEEPSDATEPPYNPPSTEEQDAAEGSQADPAVEKADGVDEQLSPQQVRERLAARLEVVITLKAVDELKEQGFALLPIEMAEMFAADCEGRKAEIRAKRGPRSNQPEQEEMFDRTGSATERGE